MSLLFIYSLINYYTAFSSVTLKPSLGGASSHSVAGRRARHPSLHQTVIKRLQSRQQLLAPLSSQNTNLLFHFCFGKAGICS